MANFAMTTRQWKREAKRNFAAFTDFTFKWESNLGYVLDDRDATMLLVEAIQYHQEWNTLTCMLPRTTGKTSIIQKADVWLNWNYPWLQTILLTATPGVADDCYDYSLNLCREHPLLDALRPSGIMNSSKKEFDTPGRMGKGRSFRFRTAGTTQTGTRGHNISIDDLEVAETVSNETQRRKMRMAMAESRNLLYKGNDIFAKRKSVGTPWDFKTIMRDQTADLHIEVPAVLIDPDNGKREYPFAPLTEEVLAEIRKDLFEKTGSDWLWRSQYLLDTSRDEETVPIRKDELVFGSFVSESLFNRIMVVDPAGGKFDANQIKDMRMGSRRGDGMTAMVGGTIEDTLFILDIFSEFVRPNEFLDAIEKMIRLYAPYEIWVESNFSGWSELIRVRVQEHRLATVVCPFWANKSKLDRILSSIVPILSARKQVFHERLRHYPKLMDEDESQYLNLRHHSLPSYDDVLDCNAMMIEKLDEHLYPGRRDREGQQRLSDAEMDRLGVPRAVRRYQHKGGSRNNGSRGVRITAYDSMR